MSVAHTAGLVVAAASADSTLVGVDVERLARKTRGEAIARRHFTPGETRTLPGIAPELRPAAFLRAWTLKEAWGKAAGFAVPAALSRVGFCIEALAAAPHEATEHPACPAPPSRDGRVDRWVFWSAGAGRTHTLGIAASRGEIVPALLVRALPLDGPRGRRD